MTAIQGCRLMAGAVAFVRTAGFGAFGGASKAALFVVPIAGGEAVRVDDWVRAVSGPSWTPDGREILFTRMAAADFTAFRVAAAGGPATPARASRATPISSRRRDTGATGPSASPSSRPNRMWDFE